MFIELMTEADEAWVEIMYLTIQRRYQMQNMQSIDRSEWPSHATLIGYKSKPGNRDLDYYRPVDYFFPLGDWLHDYQTTQRKLNESSKREREREHKRTHTL